MNGRIPHEKSIGSLPRGQAGNFKIALLAFASLFVLGMLVYSQRITNQLLEHERKVVDLYAQSVRVHHKRPVDQR